MYCHGITFGHPIRYLRLHRIFISNLACRDTAVSQPLPHATNVFNKGELGYILEYIILSIGRVSEEWTRPSGVRHRWGLVGFVGGVLLCVY